MSLRSSFSALVPVIALALALLAPRPVLAADGGSDADVDGSSDAATDASTDASSDGSSDAASDAAKDASVDVEEPPTSSDSGPITFRPDADPEPDAGTPAAPAEDGGCNAAGVGFGALASWPGALALLALARLRARRRA